MTQLTESKNILEISSQPWKPNLVTFIRGLLPAAAAIVALLIHQAIPDRQDSDDTKYYAVFLKALAALAILATIVQPFWRYLKEQYRSRIAWFAVGILLLGVWDLITLKFAWLPLPYFPGPEKVAASFVEEWQILLKCTYFSLRLLLASYAIGATVGLVMGVLIGWYPSVRYWGMPILKFIGPIPATAWVPISMMVAPSTFWAGAFLIAYAVWFPMVVMTSSGISDVRIAYIDVARTLGAGRWYQVFHVAIPSAMPSIFIGLFMGLGGAFLTLIVSEMLGVKAGLGWYVEWTHKWMEFGKMYAALIVMGAFASGVTTLMFVLRNHILAWQKGVIKW
jgi:NitT/TauT family transport system permease protein